MIVVRFSGGLGNQMFQYAAGLSLALRHDMPLKCDISAYQKKAVHNGFELENVFDGSFSYADGRELTEFLGIRRLDVLRKALPSKNFFSLNNSRYVKEPHFQYWPGFQAIQAPAYLDGYWQCERYFIEALPQVLSSFKFRDHKRADVSQLRRKISSVQAVSVHVRRGDYVKDKKNLKIHGVCTLGYYKLAFEHMAKLLKEPVFFIFSDDPKWALENIGWGYDVCFVSGHTAADSWLDLQLMSLCSHHIIANSSFSWWGARLAENTNKIVVAPDPWFSDVSISSDDVVPSRWVRLNKNEPSTIAKVPI